MAKKKIKQNSKVMMEQKRRKRRMLTLWRIVKYGVNSFKRNAWLSVAATAIMTVTLAIIFGSVVMRMAITSTVDSLTEKIGVSIYLKQDVKDSDVKEMSDKIKALSTVKNVEYTSAKEARQNYARKNVNDQAVTQALIEASNEFFASFSVTLEDIGNTQELKNLVDNDKLIQANLHANKAPTYDSNRKDTIETLSRSFSAVEKVGLFAAVIFMAISSLIIFNTIRMTTFNRREEIYMMKLIGANRNFIRGPFLVESVVVGILASVFASIIGYLVIYIGSPKLESWGISLSSIITNWTSYVFVIFPILALIGSIIGITSAWVATRKYLKI
ncbi:MAG: permease-like cell division protein FtsX [bacterium]|nr:permease-like cell division protein FtsX [bacterium]